MTKNKIYKVITEFINDPVENVQKDYWLIFADDVMMAEKKLSARIGKDCAGLIEKIEIYCRVDIV